MNTIYLDAVWLLNFLFDWMILQLVHWLTKSSSHRGWLIFGGFIASLLVPLTLFYPESFFGTFIGKIIFSLFIIICAFGLGNVKLFLKQLLGFYFVSFSLGGGLFGIYFLIGQQFQSIDGLFVTYNTGFGDMVSWIFVLICFPLIWFFTRRRLDQINFDKIRYEEMCPVTIHFNGMSKKTVGFFDSGNSLVDPFTKKPVIICDEIALRDFFTDIEWKQFRMCQEDWSFDKLPDKWISKMRIIPYQGVSGKRSFLLVFKPERIFITYDGSYYSFDSVIIGIQFGELSSDGSYHCLLHPKMMQTSKLQTIS